MGFDFSGSVGDRAGWAGGASQPAPVPDLSPHVDGGQSSTSGTNAGASVSDQSTLYMSAFYVLAALAVLWILGALVFRKARL